VYLDTRTTRIPAGARIGTFEEAATADGDIESGWGRWIYNDGVGPIIGKTRRRPPNAAFDTLVNTKVPSGVKRTRI
jgi:hypothetical protein